MAGPASSKSHRNRLLAALSPADLRLLEPHLETTTTLAVRKVLEAPHRRITNVYFMERGIVSVVAVGADSREIEVGIIGREGMSGIPVVMGDHRSPHQTYIQVAGEGRCIRARALRQAMRDSESLQAMLLKFAHAFMVQTAQTAIANGRAVLSERLARWLLMAHDRLDGDEVPLTHEFLALMLGVRRAGVTVALQALEDVSLIRAARGRIMVLDRKGLEQRAGGSYGVAEAELKRLLG